jgi:hypothetical protein
MEPVLPTPPGRYHEKNHRGPFEGCWQCGRAKAICKRKIRYDSWQDAEVVVARMNESDGYAEPVSRYRCRWCLLWHVTHATGKVRAKRAERARRRWLIGQRGSA